jgi:hypothetical protein
MVITRLSTYVYLVTFLFIMVITRLSTYLLYCVLSEYHASTSAPEVVLARNPYYIDCLHSQHSALLSRIALHFDAG